MLVNKPIFELVDELPTNNLTVSMLNALNFVAPGKWQNTVGFFNTVKTVTGKTDEELIQKISERAIGLFNDRSQGYKTALWLYQTIDQNDKYLGASVINGRPGSEKYVGPSFDKYQAIDIALKVAAELVAFCQTNRIPSESFGDFAAALDEYGGESLIRMIALTCFDGLLTLGPDFINKTLVELRDSSAMAIVESETFQNIKDILPGDDTGKYRFIRESFESVKYWMSDIVTSNNLTPQKICANLQSLGIGANLPSLGVGANLQRLGVSAKLQRFGGDNALSIKAAENFRRFMEGREDRLNDYAIFLDVATNYYEHTGTQTVARRLIERAVVEI